MTVAASRFTELQHENTTSLAKDNFCKLAINLPIFSHKAALTGILSNTMEGKGDLVVKKTLIIFQGNN